MLVEILLRVVPSDHDIRLRKDEIVDLVTELRWQSEKRKGSPCVVRHSESRGNDFSWSVLPRIVGYRQHFIEWIEFDGSVEED